MRTVKWMWTRMTSKLSRSKLVVIHEIDPGEEEAEIEALAEGVELQLEGEDLVKRKDMAMVIEAREMEVES
jgi:hypothetical protein